MNEWMNEYERFDGPTLQPLKNTDHWLIKQKNCACLLVVENEVLYVGTVGSCGVDWICMDWIVPNRLILNFFACYFIYWLLFPRVSVIQWGITAFRSVFFRARFAFKIHPTQSVLRLSQYGRRPAVMNRWSVIWYCCDFVWCTIPKWSFALVINIVLVVKSVQVHLETSTWVSKHKNPCKQRKMVTFGPAAVFRFEIRIYWSAVLHCFMGSAFFSVGVLIEQLEDLHF